MFSKFQIFKKIQNFVQKIKNFVQKIQNFVQEIQNLVQKIYKFNSKSSHNSPQWAPKNPK